MHILKKELAHSNEYLSFGKLCAHLEMLAAWEWVFWVWKLPHNQCVYLHRIECTFSAELGGQCDRWDFPQRCATCLASWFIKLRRAFQFAEEYDTSFFHCCQFSIKGIMERSHRLNHISSIEIECMEDIVFARVKRRRLQWRDWRYLLCSSNSRCGKCCAWC